MPSFLACSVAILLFCTGCVCATIPHEDLARKYAPQFRLHPSEAFLPSSIEFMFPNFKVYDDKGNLVPNQPPLLTSTNLASSLPSNGQGTFLTVQNYTNALGTFLAGKNPKTTRVPVYTFIAPKGNGVVDFYYWTYYPWNQGKIVKVVGEVDDHVSDWERMSVRTVNGVAVSADYNAHSGGSQSTGTIRWADVPKVPGEDRPIGWVAQGSHGIWDSPGKHVYQNVSYGQLTDQLVDVTANGGPKWDAKANLFPMMYIPGGAYKGTFSWLSFQGKWGNRGLTNCWWYHIAPECSLVDGPVGPARDLMSGPPSNTIATAISSNNSIYNVHISPKSNRPNYVGVTQICAWMEGNATKTSGTFGSVRSTGHPSKTLHKIIVPGCGAGHFVDSFEVSVCKNRTQNSCDFMRNATRAIRAYLPGKSGIVAAFAVQVSDPDYWRI